jgi:hypothetical protein
LGLLQRYQLPRTVSKLSARATTRAAQKNKNRGEIGGGDLPA